MIISLALASGDSYAQKESLVKFASESGIGIFVSDLPQNHDLFQLLTIWRYKYKNLPNLGSAIISPLSYEPDIFFKQVKTLFEVSDSGIELGLGLGDKNLLRKAVENRIFTFQNSINQLLADALIAKSQNIISIAGSGKKLLSFANENDLGLIYNGIIRKENILSIKSQKTKSNLSTFIMTDINPYDSLSKGFVSIVSRILTSLSQKELERLQIDRGIAKNIREELTKKNLSEYKKWLPEEIISKVAIFGSKEEIVEKLFYFKDLNIKQIILSIIGGKQKIDFIEFLKESNFGF